MKIYISSDIEGTAALCDWDEAMPGGSKYAYFADLMTKEVAKACDGALDAGWEVTVKDAHNSGRNIDPQMLPPQAMLLRGWTGDMFEMLGGITADKYDAIGFTGYHSDAFSAGNVLSHTMVRKVNRVTINGINASEFVINMFIAGYFKIPIVFLSGDEALCREAQRLVPGITTVPTKTVIGGATMTRHPDVVRSEIYEKMKESLSNINKEDCIVKMPDRFKAVIDYKEWPDANKYSNYPGAVREDIKTISFETDDYIEIIRFIMFCM